MRTLSAITKSAAVASLATVATIASANSFSGAIQPSLTKHLKHAEECFLDGKYNEAQAYAELVIIKDQLRVYVDPTSLPDAIRRDAHRAIADAINNWNNALNGQVEISLTTRDEANVIIRFTNRLYLYGGEAAGSARWSRNVMSWSNNHFSFQTLGNIVLRTHKPNGGLMNLDQLRQAAGHELGHILGLEDSYRRDDIMGPLRLDRPTIKPSAREINSLLALHERALGVLASVAPESYAIVQNNKVETQIQKSAKTRLPEKKVTVRVPSSVADEPKPTVTRDSSSKRRSTSVRSSVRDRKASRRKTRGSSFGFGF